MVRNRSSHAAVTAGALRPITRAKQRRGRTLGVALLLAVLVASGTASPVAALESLPANHPHYLAFQTVYQRIAKAFGDERPPPLLVVEPSPSQTIAYYQGGNEEQLALAAAPAKGEPPPRAGRLRESCIVFGEDLLATVGGLGTQRDGALALLVGHELAHFYRRHKVMNEFGRALSAASPPAGGAGKYPDPEQMAHDRESVEAEADYFGGFYGYLAGYDTFAAAPLVYQAVYRDYHLERKLSGYPGLDLRINIAKGAERNLQRMVQVFEAANRLLVLGYHSEAARLYLYIARIFPSCEIYNNAGVALSLAALELMPPGTTKYLYPFEFDTQSRLATRGEPGEGSAAADALLRQAGDCFDAAIRQNASYAQAYVNRAAVYQLMGKKALALGFAGEALELAADQPLTRAGALTVRGIVSAGNKQRDAAAADFAEASRLGSQQAAVDEAILAGRPLPAAETPREARPAGVEMIAGISLERPAVLDQPEFSFPIESSASEGELRVKGKHLERADLISFDETDLQLNDLAHFDLVATGKGYPGRSARGIVVGSTLAEVKRCYGEPLRVVTARQCSYLVYARARIIFVIDQGGGSVVGWMIYSRPQPAG